MCRLSTNVPQLLTNALKTSKCAIIFIIFLISHSLAFSMSLILLTHNFIKLPNILLWFSNRKYSKYIEFLSETFTDFKQGNHLSLIWNVHPLKMQHNFSVLSGQKTPMAAVTELVRKRFIANPGEWLSLQFLRVTAEWKQYGLD